MSKKALLILLAIIVLGGLVFLTKGMKKDKGDGEGAGTIKYACAAGKSFTLTAAGEGKITVSGEGVTYMALTETAKGSGYWASTDGKTTVKTVGSYVILVQNDKTTHDQCQEVK